MIINITQMNAPPPLPLGVANGLVSLGTMASNALVLTAEYNIVAIVSTGTGVRLSVTGSRRRQSVSNAGVNDLRVYPPDEHRFLGMSQDAPAVLRPGEHATYVMAGGAEWSISWGGWLTSSANLTDLPDPDVAWSAIGGGQAGRMNVGVSFGTVAAGDDPRIVNAVSSALVGAPDGLAQLGPDGRLSAAQVPSGLTSGITFRGAWNAATNQTTAVSPASLSSGVGADGDIWVVSVAGTTVLDGISTWEVGDQVWFSTGAWRRVPLSTAIAAVALTSLAQIGLTDLSRITPTNRLVRNAVFTWSDGRHISGMLKKSGQFWFANADIVTLSAGTAVLRDVTSDSVAAAAMQAAGLTYSGGSLLRRWSVYWKDAGGRLAVAIDRHGKLFAKSADFSDVVLDSIGLRGQGAITLTTDGSAFTSRGGLQVSDQAGRLGMLVRRNGTMVAALSPRIITRSSRLAVRPTLVHSYTPPRTGTDELIASNTTIATVWTLAASFRWVRIVGGFQLPTSGTIAGVVAPTASFNDGVNPVDGTGGPVAFTQLTFNALGVPGFLPHNQPVGGALTHTTPGSAIDQVWNFFVSDWARVSSLPRADGSNLPLLMVRLLLTGTPAAVAVTGANWFSTTSTIYTYGRTWAAYEASGDYVSSTGGFPSSGTSFGTHWAPLFVQAYSDELGYVMLGGGDSNTAGTGSADGFNGFLHRSGQRLTKSGIFSTCNLNQPGSSWDVFGTNLERLVDIINPTLATIMPFTFNSPQVRSTVEQNWARSMAIADRVHSNGGAMVLVGYPPRTGATAEGDALRLETLQRIDRAMASGMPGINLNSRIAVAGAPETWQPWASTDGVHLSERAHALYSDAAVQQIMARIGF